MISDDERRIVAANLRQYLKKYETPDWRAFCNIILGSGRLDNLRKAQAFDRLADLIDHPTCFDTESKDSKSFTCSACGFSESRLVVSPFTLSFAHCKPSYRYCPNCGAEVVE